MIWNPDSVGLKYFFNYDFKNNSLGTSALHMPIIFGSVHLAGAFQVLNFSHSPIVLQIVLGSSWASNILIIWGPYISIAARIKRNIPHII